jgi:hypothetical protein
MIVPLTRPASEFQATWSPTLKRPVVRAETIRLRAMGRIGNDRSNHLPIA